MANAPATTKWRHACDTSADGTRCIWRRAWCRSFRTAGHQERFEPLDGGCQFVLLDCAGGVHVLGTNLGALSHERASPDSLMLGQHVHAIMRALVTRVHVVALCERDRRWTDEYSIATSSSACASIACCVTPPVRYMVSIRYSSVQRRSRSHSATTWTRVTRARMIAWTCWPSMRESGDARSWESAPRFVPSTWTPPAQSSSTN